MWISVDDVVHFHGLKPQHLNLSKDDTTTLEEILSDWILQSESLIKTYCHIKSIEDTDVSETSIDTYHELLNRTEKQCLILRAILFDHENEHDDHRYC